RQSAVSRFVLASDSHNIGLNDSLSFASVVSGVAVRGPNRQKNTAPANVLRNRCRTEGRDQKAPFNLHPPKLLTALNLPLGISRRRQLVDFDAHRAALIWLQTAASGLGRVKTAL